MKKLTALLLVQLFFITALRAQVSDRGAQPATPSALIVHEWGTFTTLAGSDGVLLPGLYHEEEYLPDFVHHAPGFAYGGFIHKGLYLECNNVTLKMETPVIYFYSGVARSVSVRVDWPGGTISQWYPERVSGEATPPSTGTLDFAQPYNGWIQWNADIQAKSQADTMGLWKYGESHIWEAPRATDANMIRDTVGMSLTGKGYEAEKYLFYRGVGSASYMDGFVNGSYILHTFFRGDTLAIENQTNYNISHALVFERIIDPNFGTGDTINRIWWSGPINAYQKIATHAPSPGEGESYNYALSLLRDKLIAFGLYQKEADAMIATWKQSYFGTLGLRVFWIVPHSSTAKSLPLQVTPPPDELKRVLVARSEILTPTFEKQLVSDFNNGTGNYYNDRYYLAYQARVKTLGTAAVAAKLHPTSPISVYPNPSNGLFTFTLTDHGPAEISIVNLLGVEVAKLSTRDLAASSESGITWDAHDTPTGMYVCIIRSNGHVAQVPVMLVR